MSSGTIGLVTKLKRNHYRSSGGTLASEHNTPRRMSSQTGANGRRSGLWGVSFPLKMLSGLPTTLSS